MAETHNPDSAGALRDQQAEAELRQLVDAVPQHIVVLSADGRRLHANQIVLDYYGMDLEQFLSIEPSHCFHPDDLKKYEHQRDCGVASGQPWEVEARVRRMDGQYRWFLMRVKPLQNSRGQVIRWYLSGTDIEERRTAEHELRQLVDAVPQHIIVLDAEGRRLHANQPVLEYHGYTLEEFMVVDYCHCFHPDDLEAFEHRLQAGIASREPWETEVRLHGKDGQYRWFLIRANPLRDDQGRVIRWYLSRTDIEDRKRAEREVQQIVDAVPQHIVVYSADGRRLRPNKVTLDYFNWTFNEFLDDERVKEIFHPDDVASFYETKARGISSGAPFTIEARVLRKDRQYRWFLFLFKPFQDEQGEIVRWYATGTDIAEHKQAERDLQYERDRLNLLLELTNKLVSKLELQDLLHTVAESVHRIIQCDLVAVFLPNAEGQQLRRFVSAFPKKEGLIQLELADQPARRPIAIDGTLVGRVFRTGLEWTGDVADLREMGLEDKSGTVAGSEAGCVLPIVCCDRVLGVLALARSAENSFSRDDVDLLRSVASQIAIEVNNALVMEDRKRAESTLRRSEAYLAEAQRLSHTGSFAHDPVRGEITYWSEEAYRTFGFDPAKGLVTYQQARSRIHPEDLEKFEEARERGIREKTGASVDFRVVLPDGSIKYIHCVSRPFVDASGEIVELVGTNMDVTEQHLAHSALQKAFEEIKQLKEELYRENLALKEEVDQASFFEEIVGSSEPLRRVLVQVTKVAPADSTVLISGETGTGKELIARAIHKRSPRSSRAFVSVNCAAIPTALIGSELFGHEKGAFTGATQRRLGRFELAEGGTLFLDEVGDLPTETQISLLRVLQERQFERIGGNQPIRANVRIIVATNRDLRAAINAGTFRNDLFYRLNVFPIDVPPLRDRKEDIPLLVEYLTERYASKAGKKIKNIEKRTLELLNAYQWPGNIRELQNVIERAVILCDGDTLSVDEVWLQQPSRQSEARNGLARLGSDRERTLIESALRETKGRVSGPSGAAAKLGIPRSTLETKIRTLGIDKHLFKSRSAS